MRFSAKTPNIYSIEKDLYVRLRCRRSDMLNWYLIFKRQDEERAIDITVIKNLLQNFVDIYPFPEILERFLVFLNSTFYTKY